MPDTIEPPPVVNPPAAEASVPWYQKAFSDAGECNAGWQDHIPGADEHRALFAQFSSLPALAQTLKDNMTLARGKATAVVPPTDESTPEQVAAYRKATGIPETPYALARPEKLPEGVDWSDEDAKTFGELAHKINLTPAQLQALTEYDIARTTGANVRNSTAYKAQIDKQLAEEEVALRATYGAKLDETIMSAQRVAQLGGLTPDHMDPRSPNFQGIQMLGFFSRIAESLGESRLPTVAAVSNMNPLAMAREIIRKNPEYGRDPALNAQVDELYKKGAEMGLR